MFKRLVHSVTVDITGTTAAVNTDGIRVVTAVAYAKGEKNYIYTHDGLTFGEDYMGVADIFFTGVLYNIPEDKRDDVIVGRPYIKIGGVYYYGDCISRSYNDVAVNSTNA